MNAKSILKIAFLGVFFAACGGKSSLAYPDWYVKPEKNAKYLYGVGEAETLQGAKSAALNDLASSIALQLDSDISLQKERINDDFTSSALSNISISVRDMGLESVEYPLIEKVDGAVFVQARLEKSKVVKRLNDELAAQMTELESVIGQVGASRCPTISPKHKNSLAASLHGADFKARLVRAFGGAPKNAQLVDEARVLLAQPSKASYAAFASGGSSGDYMLVDSALMSEFGKFFSVIAEDSGIYRLENTYAIYKDNEKVSIQLRADIRDCTGSVVFSNMFESTQKFSPTAVKSAVDRLRAQLFKKLDSWAKSAQ